MLELFSSFTMQPGYTSVSVLAKENGGSLVCPTVWSLGEEISLTFYIDRSKYPGVCTGGYSRYSAFEKSTDSKKYFANCSVKDDITQNGSCSTSLGLGECGCTSKNASFYEIKYKFQAHSDYNGWWRPDLACIDERPEQLLSYTLSQGCTNVSVGKFSGDKPLWWPCRLGIKQARNQASKKIDN